MEFFGVFQIIYYLSQFLLGLLHAGNVLERYALLLAGENSRTALPEGEYSLRATSTLHPPHHEEPEGKNQNPRAHLEQVAEPVGRLLLEIVSQAVSIPAGEDVLVDVVIGQGEDEIPLNHYRVDAGNHPISLNYPQKEDRLAQGAVKLIFDNSGALDHVGFEELLIFGEGDLRLRTSVERENLDECYRTEPDEQPKNGRSPCFSPLGNTGFAGVFRVELLGRQTNLASRSLRLGGPALPGTIPLGAVDLTRHSASQALLTTLIRSTSVVSSVTLNFSLNATPHTQTISPAHSSIGVVSLM